MSGYKYLEPGIKAWTKGVPVEHEAMVQLHNVASLPFIHKHVAVMPDAELFRIVREFDAAKAAWEKADEHDGNLRVDELLGVEEPALRG